MQSSLAERWTTILDRLREEGRYRSLAPPCGVDFSSNDYLGFGKESPESDGYAPARQAQDLARKPRGEALRTPGIHLPVTAVC